MKTIAALLVVVFMVASCNEDSGICKDGYLYDIQDGTLMPRINDRGLIACKQ